MVPIFTADTYCTVHIQYAVHSHVKIEVAGEGGGGGGGGGGGSGGFVQSQRMAEMPPYFQNFISGQITSG